ncbi:MAG: electron transport complex protein RnfA [Planctomycetota bacterium]
MEYLKLFFGVVFVSNLVLAQFLGLCPFIGVSRKQSSAVGMGFAVTFVITMASVVCHLLFAGVLIPLKLDGFLQVSVFILVIATLVQFVEMVIQKVSPPLYKALGIYLPLITTNCAVLGVTQLNMRFAASGLAGGFLKATIQGFGGGVGFMIGMILISSIREDLEGADIPESLKGVPIAFVITASLALAFLGFAGMV